MTVEMERELKWTLLSAVPLSALQAVLGRPANEAEQLNRYFLPLSPSGTMVRFREQCGGLLLSVKRGGSRNELGYYVREECNHPVPPEYLFEFQETGGCAELERLECMAGLHGPYEFVGLLLNTRRMWRWEGLEVELDRTEYPDGEMVWEVEVETDSPEAAAPLLARLLERCGVAWCPSDKGKFGRLREKLSAKGLHRE